jgi:hypothetical protein
MKIALAVLILLCGVGDFAESQIPVTTPSESSSKTYTEAKHSEQTTDHKKSVNLDSHIAVKAIPAPDAGAKATKQEKAEEKKANESVPWLTITRDSMQTIFYLVIVAVTVLTYLSAKKTLLQPIRTETFKEQLKAFSEIMIVLAGKSEMELRADFGFKEYFDANVVLLLDNYARLFFDLKIDEDKRPYSRDKCPISLVSAEALEVNDAHIRVEREPAPEPHPSVKATLWSKFKIDELRIPRITSDYFEKIKKLQQSPLIPTNCVTLLKDYERTLHENVTALGKVLLVCVEEIPPKYPNVETLKRSDSSWIWNKYNSSFVSLEDQAKKVSAFIKEYLGTDYLVK